MDFEKAKEALLDLAQKQGYLTFDNIIDSSDHYNLSITEVDNLSELIPMLGIVVYEKAPSQHIQVAPSKDNNLKPQKQEKHSVEQKNRTQPDSIKIDEVDDFARVSYSTIFNRVLELQPELEPFIKFVKSIPAPQAGETIALTRQLVDGNQYARERLINMHLRLAIKVALNCTEKYNFHIEDAITDSIDGLITAIDKFDVNGFNAFSSYASLWMQQKIMRFSEPKWLEHYAPFHFKEKLVKAKSIRDNHLCENCDRYRICPSLRSEISELLSVSIYDAEEYLNLIEANESNISIDELLVRYEVDSERELDIDEIESESAIYELSVDTYEAIDQIVFANDLREIIARTLQALTPKERTVIIKRYGLNDGSPQTLEEVGNALHVTRERIRQIEMKAFRKLKHPSRIKYYSSYVERTNNSNSTKARSNTKEPKVSHQPLLKEPVGDTSEFKFDVLSLIDMYNVPYVDKRDKGGRLWVIGSDEIVPFVLECKDNGYEFRFAENGSSSTNKKSAWWLLD